MSTWDILIFGLIVAVLVVVAGLLLSARDTPESSEQPDTLSQAKKDALRAWAMRQKMPPAPEMVELAQEWLTLCRKSETKEKGE